MQKLREYPDKRANCCSATGNPGFQINDAYPKTHILCLPISWLFYRLSYKHQVNGQVKGANIMRLLLAAILIAALGWSGFWWIGARNINQNLTDWLDTRHQAGWVANYSSLDTNGFPNRFDTEIRDIELVDTHTGIAWTAPFFQLFRLSYEQSHVIAVWPNQQVVATPNQRIDIRSDDIRASLVLRDTDTWLLDRMNLVVDDLSLSSSNDWSARIEQSLFAMRPSERVPAAIDLALKATNVHPKNPALTTLAEMGAIPRTIESLDIDLSVTFDAPLDRRVIEVGRPNITALDLHVLKSKWGGLELWAAGDLTLDSQGRATGSITIKAKNWREMLQLAKASGWIPDAAVDPLTTGLGFIATLSGSKQTLDAPLTFDRGNVSFGPIPLGTLPPIKMR